MSAHSSSSENSSSIWSLLNKVIGTILGGVVLLWVLAFVAEGLGSLRPKPKAENLSTAAAAPAAPAADLPTLEVTIKPDGPSGMAFDTKAISAKVGQKIKLTLNNSHPLPLPHNIVVGKVGTKDKMTAIATAGMTLVDKGFIPDSPDILAHTGLVQATKSETIEFTVAAAGEYPFFCTFPGHFMLMNGLITVQ
ncbi:plastocyanin/azurin family copper-binding protein [Prosthecobacter sp.]|uniref:plastocyanin/azurin family copper-binding protein n=1 Tax=Prosthecobacter sp. TaxID=1965333 RepID=UPI0037839131